jgi:hypothetical protein
MTEHSPGGSPDGQRATAAVKDVGGQAVQAGGQVTQTVKEQGREVVAEATHQARDLFGQARDQFVDQACAQQRRAAGGLRSLADEMRSMAEQGGQSGPVTALARQAASRTQDVAGWLDQRQPGDLVNEVRAYARRHPGAFLAGAALLGVLAGRLVRNASTASDGPPVADRDGRDQTAPAVGDGDGAGDSTTLPLPPTTPVTGTTGVHPGPNPPVVETDPLPGVPSLGARP